MRFEIMPHGYLELENFPWSIAIPSNIFGHFHWWSQKRISGQKLINKYMETAPRKPRNVFMHTSEDYNKCVWCSFPLGNRPGRSSTSLKLGNRTAKNDVSEYQKLIKGNSKTTLEMVKNLFREPRNIFPRSGQTISNIVGRQLAQLLLVVEQTKFP